jgi:hypothetical protein
MSVADELGLDFDTVHRLLTQLVQDSADAAGQCAAQSLQIAARLQELQVAPPADERVPALEQGSRQLGRVSQSNDEAAARLQKLDTHSIHESLGHNRPALEELEASARRAAQAAASEDTLTRLSESAGRADEQRQEMETAHQQLRGQTRETWQALAPSRSGLQQRHDDALQEGTRTQQELEQHHAEFVGRTLRGTAEWLEQQHRPGMASVVADKTRLATGALDDYARQASQASQRRGQASQESAQAVHNQASAQLSVVEQGLKRATTSLQNSQSRALDSAALARGATDHAPRVLGLLSEVHQLSKTLDPKGFTRS